MTWSFPPNHIVPAGVGVAPTSQEDLPNSPAVIVCGALECPTNSSFGPTFLACPIATALAAIPDAYDWYAIAVEADFSPVIAGIDSCQPVPPFLSPCTPDQTATTSGDVDCSLVKMSDGTGFASSNSSSGHAGAPGWSIGDISSSTDSSFVVNPSSSFPVPDADGDTAGEILFTRAELLALDGALGFTWQGDWAQADGGKATVHINVIAYLDTRAPVAPFICLL